MTKFGALSSEKVLLESDTIKTILTISLLAVSLGCAATAKDKTFMSIAKMLNPQHLGGSMTEKKIGVSHFVRL